MILRTYLCDGPECGHNEEGTGNPNRETAIKPPPYLPPTFLEIRHHADAKNTVWHFCSWDCVMRYAAKYPSAEPVEAD